MIIIAPHSILHTISKRVEEVTPEIQNILQSILQAANENNAIGLAASHIGINLQLVVININTPIFMINPKILWRSQSTVMSEEGSVSFPGIIVQIQRHTHIQVKYLNYDGIEEMKNFEKQTAICIQHEIDQMNGITILDSFSPLKRDLYLKKVQKYVKMHKK